jgi:hypothetical protein
VVRPSCILRVPHGISRSSIFELVALVARVSHGHEDVVAADVN